MKNEKLDEEDIVYTLESMAYIIDEGRKEGLVVLMLDGSMFLEASEEIKTLRAKIKIILGTL